jgi:CBS domain-containing protein
MEITRPDLPSHRRHRAVPVSEYMSAPVRVIAPDARMALAEEMLRRHRISSLLVVEGGRPVGLLSRTDVIDEMVDDPDLPLAVPGGSGPVASRMTRSVLEVNASDTVFAACALMLEAEIHQVLVVDDGEPVGVLSRSDAVAAVRDLRLDGPLGEAATRFLFTVEATQPLREVERMLGRAEVGTVLVMEDRFPVGVYGQREQILARQRPRDSSVGAVMNQALLVLPAALPLHRAAGQLVATRASFIVVIEDGMRVGVLTATDFCRVLGRLR